MCYAQTPLQHSTYQAFEHSYWLEVRNPLLDSLDVFIVQNGHQLAEFHTGDHWPFDSRPLRYNSFIFPLSAEASGTVEVYLRIRSVDQKLLPVFVGSREAFYSVKGNQELIFGMYIGLMLVMFLYNSFIYFTTRDRSYLYYIGYILALLITQMLLEGFAYRRLFPGIPWMHDFGVVKLAELDPLDEEVAQMFQMIESSVNRLDIFIQSIIEYYQNSRDVQEVRPIDFEALIKDILANLRYYDGSETVLFKVDVAGAQGFKGDEFRLRIILSNLISNAIKYRRLELSEHQVDIRVQGSAQQVTIAIEDNGVGILQEHMQNIFKMFFRADSYRSGSGIGLYIVKEALERIDGTINVTSKVNEGTLFEITLPSLES